MLICTIKALNYYLKYIKRNDIKNAYIYILGLKLGPVLKFKKRKIKNLGITTIVNPDGLEHKRSKWGVLVKKFFLLSEKWMLNNCDLIICDALGIKRYINNKYPKLKDNPYLQTVIEAAVYKISQGIKENVKTVQFHPEACAGPLDTAYLFDEFMKMK